MQDRLFTAVAATGIALLFSNSVQAGAERSYGAHECANPAETSNTVIVSGIENEILNSKNLYDKAFELAKRFANSDQTVRSDAINWFSDEFFESFLGARPINGQTGGRLHYGSELLVAIHDGGDIRLDVIADILKGKLTPVLPCSAPANDPSETKKEPQAATNDPQSRIG